MTGKESSVLGSRQGMREEEEQQEVREAWSTEWEETAVEGKNLMRGAFVARQRSLRCILRAIGNHDGL